MPKKTKPPEGAPMYMQLYTTLMILLLAFFIVLCTMTNDQESGFHSGIGDVKDAFGTQGGLGLLSYDLFRVPGTSIPVPVGNESDTGDLAVGKAMVEGDGGPGNSDAPADPLAEPEYLRIGMPFQFAPGSATLTPDMAEYLEITGTEFSVFDVHLVVRSCATESGTDADGELASRRALAIVRFLHRACGVPYDHMQAVGYASDRYLGAHAPAAESPAAQQTYFYVMQKT